MAIRGERTQGEGKQEADCEFATSLIVLCASLSFFLLLLFQVLVRIASKDGFPRLATSDGQVVIPYGFTCDFDDPFQKWSYSPVKGLIRGIHGGQCLSIPDGNDKSKSYSLPCNGSDPRQQWQLSLDSCSTTAIQSSTLGSCLAIADDDPYLQPYGTSCSGSDPRQEWVALGLEGN